MTLLRGLVCPFPWPRRSLARIVLVRVVALVALASAPATAAAHAGLTRAMEHAADAEFDTALAAFEEALASGTLSRDELITLLAERILVLHAVGKKQQLDDDLSTLVMLGGEDALDRRAPPQLIDALTTKKRERQQPLAFDARCEPSATGTKIQARVDGLSAKVPVTLRIHVRGAAESRWSRHEASEVELTSEMGKEVAYYGELLGFGGIVLARAATLEKPRACSTPAEPTVVQTSAAQPADEAPAPRTSRKKWWWVGAGGVLAIGAVTVAVLATRDDPQERSAVSNPMVKFE